LGVAEDLLSNPQEESDATSGLSAGHRKHGNVIAEEDQEELPAGDGEPSLHEHVEHPEARVIAYIMMLSLAWQMSILWFVNYPEPGMRQLAARMVCTAVAVCCAVLVNQAIFSFIFDQVLTGKEGRGLGMKRSEIGVLLSSFIGAGVFLCNLFILNVGCWYYRHKPNQLRAFALVSAHMLAWSGIEAFGNLRLSSYFHNTWRDKVTFVPAQGDLIKQVGFIVIVSVFFFLFFGLAACLRKYLERRLDTPHAYTQVQHDANVAPGETANMKIPLWLEELAEAEQDAAALVLGFLTLQSLISLITGMKNVSVHDLHRERQFSEAALIQASAVMFLLVLVVVSFIMHSLGMNIGRSTFNFRGYLAMSMAWCFERAGEWTMNLVWDDIWMARIWSAYMLSIFSVACVLAMKRIVDKTQERLNRRKAIEKISPDELEEYLHTLNCHLRQGVDQTNAKAVEEGLDESRMQELSSAMDQGSVDKLMHTVVSGFSVVIGLVWDMGYEAAETIIVAPGKVGGPYPVNEVGQWFVRHPVMARVALCCFLVAIVVPGWSRHLVPAARKPWRVHMEDIVREKRLQKEVHVIHLGDGGAS